MDRELVEDLARLFDRMSTLGYRLAPAPPLTAVEVHRIVRLVYGHRYSTTTAEWLVDLVLSKTVRLSPTLSSYSERVQRQVRLLLQLQQALALVKGIASAAARTALREDFVRALQRVCPLSSNLRVELWELLKKTRASGPSALIAEDIAHLFYPDEFSLGDRDLRRARKRLERQRQRIRDGRPDSLGRDSVILIPVPQIGHAFAPTIA